MYWSFVSNQFKKIGLGAGKHMCAITLDNKIMVRIDPISSDPYDENNELEQSWLEMPALPNEATVADVDCGADGVMLAMDTNNNMYRYYKEPGKSPSTDWWHAMKIQLNSFTVANNAMIYGINTNGDAVYYEGEGVLQKGYSPVVDVKVGYDGTLIAISNPSKAPIRLTSIAGGNLMGPIVSKLLCVHSANKIMLVDQDDNIWSYIGESLWHQHATSEEYYYNANNQAFEFKNIAGEIVCMRIGADGNCYMITYDSNAAEGKQYTTYQQLEKLPELLVPELLEEEAS